MLKDYLDLIQQQRQHNPLFPKDYSLLQLPKFLYNYSQTLTNLNSYPNAFLSNIIYRNIPLYINNNDNYYYEFVDKGVGYNTTLKDWKYFYIPLSQFNSVQNRLPSYKYYNINLNTNINTFLLKSSVFYINNNNIKIDYIFNNENNRHPLFSHFIFTGGITITNNGSAIYEYIDNIGYSNDSSIKYFSNIKPLNFEFQSNELSDNYFFNDDLLSNNINKAPQYNNLYNEVYKDFQFTGRVTNQKFSNLKKWYEYYLYENGFPIESVILPSPPSNNSLTFIDIQLYNKNIRLHFNQLFNNQSLNINQISSNKIINIS